MRVFALLALLTITGCATSTPSGTAMPPLQGYIAAGAVDLTHLLPPPPAPGSPEEAADLAALHIAQSTRTPALTARAEEDAHVSLALFARVLGPSFEPSKLPVMTGFFGKVGAATGPFITIAKGCWQRKRPFEIDASIEPPGTMKQEVANRTLPAGPSAAAPRDPNSPCLPPGPSPAYIPSYPSGHALWGAMTGTLLAEMVPEKRSELFERGWQIGDSRVIGGVHYPSDVAAARIEAEVLVAMMMQSTSFRADLRAARSELRGALGLVDAKGH